MGFSGGVKGAGAVHADVNGVRPIDRDFFIVVSEVDDLRQEDDDEMGSEVFLPSPSLSALVAVRRK
jgi:hypothetical protein